MNTIIDLRVGPFSSREALLAELKLLADLPASPERTGAIRQVQSWLDAKN